MKRKPVQRLVRRASVGSLRAGIWLTLHWRRQDYRELHGMGSLFYQTDFASFDDGLAAARQ